MTSNQELAKLGSEWMAAKYAETEATERRRSIEDRITAAMDVTPTADGTKRAEIDGMRITVSTRLNRRVDGDKVQEIAAERGVEWPVLQRLFRWRPELNVREWRAEHETITGPLSAAITTTAGRPSVSVEISTDED